ncbi:MAG: hypothetical protein FWH20_03435 [Oscillospiraceae bacterium]|nr:hypothetical protein [Oscillospiraceae bacterium]
MNCFYHETKAAVSQCRNNCGKYLCADCYNQSGGSCPDCAVDYVLNEKEIARKDIKAFKWGSIIGGVLFVLPSISSVLVSLFNVSSADGLVTFGMSLLYLFMGLLGIHAGGACFLGTRRIFTGRSSLSGWSIFATWIVWLFLLGFLMFYWFFAAPSWLSAARKTLRN